MWCILFSCQLLKKTVRQSVSLPAHVACQVKSLAKISSASANCVIVDLIEIGIEARDQEKKRFFELADYSQPYGGCNFEGY